MKGDLPVETETPFRNLPPGYRQVLAWKISDKFRQLVIMNIIMFPLLFIFGWPYYILAYRGLPEFGTVALYGWLWIPALILTIVVHELIHGLFIKLYGGSPKFGFMPKAGAFYATADRYAFPRNPYLVIALSPLVLLSLAFVPLVLLARETPYAMPLVISAAMNAASSLGDLWISSIVLRYPSHAYVVDEKDGMRVCLPAEEAAQP